MKKLLLILPVVFCFACDSSTTPSTLVEENICGIELEDIENYSCTFESHSSTGETILTDEQEQVYLDIWKTLLFERTGMTEAYFDAHFSNIHTYAHDWNSGKTFNVTYDFEVDWLKITHRDDFLIYMNSSLSSYPQHNIPRDQFLDKSWIEFFLDNRVASSDMVNVKPIETLAFSDCREAVNHIRAETGLERLTPNKYSFFVAGKQPQRDGYPYLIVSGIENPNANECSLGYINLFDKSLDGHMSVCCIIG